MMEPVKVVLGGTEYAVRPLSVEQRLRIDIAKTERMESISAEGMAEIMTAAAEKRVPVLSRADASAIAASWLRLRYDVVTIALERSDPQPIKGSAIEATEDEFAEAYRVLDAAFFPKREAAPGEAGAQAS